MNSKLSVTVQKPSYHTLKLNWGESRVVMEFLNEGKPIPRHYRGDKMNIIDPIAGMTRVMLKAGEKMKKLGIPITRENLEAAYELNRKDEYLRYTAVPVYEISEIILPKFERGKVAELTDDLGVFTKDGQVYVSSLNVAKVFEKRHDNILQDIRSLDCSKDFTVLNFQGSEYKDGTGRSLPCYNLTRDGFTFLCMGYTGKKAAAFKEAYIKRFNEMEKAISNPDQRQRISGSLRCAREDAAEGAGEACFKAASPPALEAPRPQEEVYPPEKAAEMVGLRGYRVLYTLLVQFGLIYRYSYGKGYFPTIEALENEYIVTRRTSKKHQRPHLTVKGLKYVRDRIKALR